MAPITERTASNRAGSGVSIAVIGVGRWGSNIVRDLIGLGVDVVAIDPDPVACNRALDLGAARGHSRLDELDTIDGVIVATPASTHVEDVLACADLEVPIACEKPLAVSTANARAIVDAVGDRLTVLHVWRYHPGIELLGELTRSGALGAVSVVRTTRTNWTSPRTDVDPVWTLLPHDLSIAVELLGHVPFPTQATVERIGDRSVSIWASFGSETALLVEATTRSDERRRDVRVHGSEAVAVLHDGAEEVHVLTGSTTKPHIEAITFDPTPALRRELSAFVEHVDGGPPPKTNAAEGLAVVDAVERALGLAAIVESGAHR